ncbi:MAG: acyl-homoserine-lactone synthase, partial [Nitrospirota bacterium]|nr:acyl-homoserine-lactone synthase [Nitrospirota bacterium]
MRGVKDIEFSENGFTVKTLYGEQLAQSYRLRHKVFAESLKWVPETDDREEIDLYDLWGTTLGLVRDDGAVVGMARLIPSSG